MGLGFHSDVPSTPAKKVSPALYGLTESQMMAMGLSGDKGLRFGDTLAVRHRLDTRMPSYPLRLKKLACHITPLG